MKQKGFTLIELLVVISVIGLLASVILVSVNNARAKSRDARRKADLQQIQKAMELYFDKTGSYPINRNPGSFYTDANADFLQELQDNGFLARGPKDPQSPERLYHYYDYGGACGYFLIAQVEDPSNNPDLSGVAGGTCAGATLSCIPGVYYCVNGRGS